MASQNMRKLSPAYNFVSYALSLLLLVAVANNARAAEFVASPKPRVVVIDPGHGGASRPGAVHGGILEKDINLAVSLEVYRLLGEKAPDVEVYLTRDKDIELHADKNTDNLSRPRLANSKGADLFISIHSNAVDDTSVAGAEVIVLSLDGSTQGYAQKRTKASPGEDYIHIDNIDRNSIAFIEALSLLMNNDPINRTFGDIVGNKFRSIGRKYRGIKVYKDKVWTVLYPLRGPGIIVEIGFMSNPAELKYINSVAGQKKIAGAICDAIIEYLSLLDEMTVGGTSTEEKVTDSNGATQTTEAAAEPKSEAQTINEGYTIQVMASLYRLTINESRFGKLHTSINEFEGGGTYKYKYCYGRYATLAEAKNAIAEAKSIFTDAYIVQFKDGKLK